VLVASSLLSRLLHAHSRQIMLPQPACRPGDPTPALSLSPLRSRGSRKPSLALGPPVLAAHSRCDAHSLRRDGTLSTGDRHRSVPNSAVARGGSAEASLPLESCCYFPPIHPQMQYIGLVGLVFSLLQLRRGRVRSARSRASLLQRSQAVSTVIPRVSE
jgi:hypothetical protein